MCSGARRHAAAASRTARFPTSSRTTAVSSSGGWPHVKHAQIEAQPVAALALDQTLHVVALLALALLAGQ